MHHFAEVEACCAEANGASLLWVLLAIEVVKNTMWLVKERISVLLFDTQNLNMVKYIDGKKISK